MKHTAILGNELSTFVHMRSGKRLQRCVAFGHYAMTCIMNWSSEHYAVQVLNMRFFIRVLLWTKRALKPSAILMRIAGGARSWRGRHSGRTIMKITGFNMCRERSGRMLMSNTSWWDERMSTTSGIRSVRLYVVQQCNESSVIVCIRLPKEMNNAFGWSIFNSSHVSRKIFWRIWLHRSEPWRTLIQSKWTNDLWNNIQQREQTKLQTIPKSATIGSRTTDRSTRQQRQAEQIQQHSNSIFKRTTKSQRAMVV